MSLKNKNLKNSSFCFLLSDKNGLYAVYHSLSCNVIYGREMLRNIFAHFIYYNNFTRFKPQNRKSRELYRILYKEGFIVSSDFNDLEQLRNLQTQVKKNLFIKTLYLSLTYKCNLRCSYCISNNSVALGENNKIMSAVMDKKIAKLAANYYLNNISDKGDKEVVFYGGEPLLNFKILKFLVDYIRKKEQFRIAKNRDYKKSRFILCTNGTLIDEQKALFIKKNDIYPALTFDGDEVIHNKTRKYINNMGTYQDVLKAYHILQKLNFPLGITLTLGKHNVGQLSGFVEFFARELTPSTMATNIMIDYEGGGNDYVVDGNTLANHLIEAFKVARQEGIYLVKYVIDNRVKPFVEKLPRLKGCTGTGSRIMVLPDGSVSPCMAYAKKYQLKIQDNPDVKNFMPEGIEYYSPFLKNQCRSCFAISCCGGGCPRNAEVKYGTLFGLDDDYCIQSKMFLEWLIWDLFKSIDRKKLEKESFVVPSQDDRKKIYGKIKVYENPLDFQYTPNVPKES